MKDEPPTTSEEARGRRVRCAVFEGPDDYRTCRLCRKLLGMRVGTDRYEYYLYTPPLHVRCRHYWRYIAPDDPEWHEEIKSPPVTEMLDESTGILKRVLSPETSDEVRKRFLDPLWIIAFDIHEPAARRAKAFLMMAEILHACGEDALALHYCEESLRIHRTEEAEQLAKRLRTRVSPTPAR